jgi:hypothetical protein
VDCHWQRAQCGTSCSTVTGASSAALQRGGESRPLAFFPRTLVMGTVYWQVSIACPHLAELFTDFQKKAMDKAVKALHDPPQAKSGKPASATDNDDINSIRAQLEKSEACVKKLEASLSDSGRKPHGTRDSKDSDPERPPAPKKTNKPKSPAPPASTDTHASD